MLSKEKQTQLLFELLEKEGPDVTHLPYTPAFENLCGALSKQPSIQEKHKIWERILELGSNPEEEKAPPARASTEPKPAIDAIAPNNPSAPPPQKGLSPHQFSHFLFETNDAAIPSLIAEQPWSVRPIEAALSPELEMQRQHLLAEVADSRLGTMEQRVAYLLHHFPETRDSDVALCIRYWRHFQADVIEKWQPLELEVLFALDKLETIGRIRREIQNKLRLFRGMEDTTQYRDLLQKEFHEYLASHKDTIPEIRFYLDETGNEGDKTYTGVARLCIINWQQYEKHHAAIAQWRRSTGSPETIHFSETGVSRIDRAIALLGELEKRRSGILFLGYAVSSRGRTNEDLFTLFIQLVIDSLGCLKRDGCLSEPRSVRVIKEAQSGFDSIFLSKMHRKMSDLVALEFPGQVIVQPIDPVPKGRDVFLECADLIAGGMQRRALMRGRNPKDKLAEAVFNVTGFEERMDGSAVFKLYPASY
jgi:hypothetical protein